MNLPSKENVAIVVSILGFLLGCLNFAHLKVSQKKDRKKQKRSDQIELQQLLDKSWQLLYGPDGFIKSRNRSKFEDAESAIEQALIIDSTSARAIRYCGLLHHILGKKALAREKFEEAIKLNPHYGPAYNCLGLVLEGDAAVTAFRRAVECDPNEAHSHNNLANLLEKMGNRSEADKHFLRATELEPKNAVFLIARARFLVKNGKSEEARKLYEEAVSVEPNNVDALVELGALVAAADKWDEGMAWIEHAIRSDPKDSYPLLMTSALHADRKEPEKALALHARALQLDPKLLRSGDISQEIIREMRKLIESSKVKSRFESLQSDASKST